MQLHHQFLANNGCKNDTYSLWDDMLFTESSILSDHDHLTERTILDDYKKLICIVMYFNSV